MAGAAKWLVERGLADGIDINMGCPVRKVVKTGGGSAMMCDTTGATVELVRKVVEAVPVPVTVKMRLGWDDDNLTAPYFAREFEKVGVAAVTIHGRTREQGFTGGVNLDGIRRVVEAVERIPVFGNGDVRIDRRRGADDRRDRLPRHRHRPRGARRTRGSSASSTTGCETGDPGPRGDLRRAARVHAAAPPPADRVEGAARSTAASSSARSRRGTRRPCGCRRRCSSGS